MKNSLKNKIYKYLLKHDWVSGGQIERLVILNTNNKASTASRICRKMAEEGLLERKLEGKTVFYKAIEQNDMKRKVGDYSQEDLIKMSLGAK